MCVFPMQPCTDFYFGWNIRYSSLLSEMTIFNNCFIVNIFISTLNTILLHLHCKRSPNKTSGNVHYSSQTLHKATADGSVLFDKHSK